MVVVADTGPLNYLILIDAAGVLEPLYRNVVAPQSVVLELASVKAPPVVRTWIASAPFWLDIRPDPLHDPSLSGLDPGESAAISLALEIPAARILIDDAEGRTEAVRHGLLVTGTIGVLIEAHRAGLLDFETAISLLTKTSFYLSSNVLTAARRVI